MDKLKKKELLSKEMDDMIKQYGNKNMALLYLLDDYLSGHKNYKRLYGSDQQIVEKNGRTLFDSSSEKITKKKVFEIFDELNIYPTLRIRGDKYSYRYKIQEDDDKERWRSGSSFTTEAEAVSDYKKWEEGHISEGHHITNAELQIQPGEKGDWKKIKDLR